MQKIIRQESYDHKQVCFCQRPNQSSREEFTDNGVTYKYCADCAAELRDYYQTSETSWELDSSQIQHIPLRNPEEAKIHIRVGDHIAWKMYKKSISFYHHAIVIDKNTRSLELVHYAREYDENSTRKIHRAWFNFDSSKINYPTLFCVKYPLDLVKANPPSLVIKRALLRIHERSYNLLWNNCESFATFCKRGVGRSLQVSRRVCSISKNVGKLLLDFAATPRILVWAAEFIGSEGVEALARAGVQHITHANVIGGVIYLIAEGIFCCVDIYQLYGARHDKSIGEKEFRRAVVRRVVVAVIRAIVGASSSVLGGMVGATAGTFIAGPIGTLLGTFVGSVLGGVGSVATFEGYRTIIWSFLRSEDVEHINDLQIGDHIVIWGGHVLHPRCHAIVSDINTANSRIEIIRNKYKEGVVKEWVHFQKMQRIRYSVGECYRPVEVIERAEHHIGERHYSIATFNCKTFARKHKMKEVLNF